MCLSQVVMKTIGIALLLLVVSAKLPEVNSLLCYSCKDLPSNDYCFNVTNCPDAEKCYGRADGFQTSEVKHTTGCTKELTPLKTNVSGAYSFCSMACDKDLCNLEECSRDSAHSTRAPRCLSCDLVTSPDRCRNIVQCSSDEICFVSKIETFQQIRYRLGCMGKQHCSKPVSTASLVGRRSSSECSVCCSSDHCNLHACQGTGEVYQLESMSPGVNCPDSDPALCLSIGRLNNDACIDPVIVKSCPKSCDTCDHVGWSPWLAWGQCSDTVNCKNGTKTRVRTCQSRLNLTKQQSCVGSSSDSSKCCVPLVTNFAFENCRDSEITAIRFSNVTLTPDPVIVPGNFTLSYRVNILKPIDNASFELKRNWSKHVLFGMVGVPCYPWITDTTCAFSACDIFDLGHLIALGNGNVTSKLPVSCPLPVGTFDIPPTTVSVEPSGFLKTLLIGHHRLHVELMDKRTNMIVGCFNLKVSYSEECSGIACLIG